MVQAQPLFTEFRSHLQVRAEQQRDELKRLYAERERLDACIRNAEQYAQDLNPLLRNEGLELIGIGEPASKVGTGFAAPGNRNPHMPQRRAAYAGMSIRKAVATLLHENDDEMHADAIATSIYDVKRTEDVQLAKHSLVSTLAAGVKSGDWERTAPNTFRAHRNGGN